MNLEETLKKLKAESRKLVLIDEDVINKVLSNLALRLEKNSASILEANASDLKKIDANDPIYDRVLLNEERIKNIAQSICTISEYKSPISEILEEKVLENGLKLKKIRVPIGVVGVIFEARPNVIIDVFSLCFKSRNACVMKGGSQCNETNLKIMKIIYEVLDEFNLKNAAFLLPNDRELVNEMLKSDKYIDVIIPRGGKDLIRFVRDNSSIPVIETGAGVCHMYFDESGDIRKGAEILFNAKTTRPSVCNSLDTMLIHSSQIKDLPELCAKLIEKNVEIRACKRSYEILKGKYKDDLLLQAKDEDFGTEYLSLKMSIKVVDSLEEAIEHINTYGSGHSEAIVTENKENAEKFLNAVDAAAVYLNASIRFTDGGVFGLGAEIGISTQKLHARGPMGIKELTSYKWQIIGDGQVRL